MLKPELEDNIKFNLNDHINKWFLQLKSEPAITESDSEELKSHLLDMIDGLQKSGLDEEEAFWVASKRMGNSFEWMVDYQEVNKPLIQMRKSLFILAGVLTYFLLYYFLLVTSKLLLIILLLFEIEKQVALMWVIRYLGTFHFLFLILVISIYFCENWTVKLFENINPKPSHSIFLLISTIALGIIDTGLLPVVKNMVKHGIPLEGPFYDIYFYLKYTFPLMICVSFVFLYFKYLKKTMNK